MPKPDAGAKVRSRVTSTVIAEGVTAPGMLMVSVVEVLSKVTAVASGEGCGSSTVDPVGCGVSQLPSTSPVQTRSAAFNPAWKQPSATANELTIMRRRFWCEAVATCLNVRVGWMGSLCMDL
ncbi:hypothetical protein CKA38_00050 [Ereboglobus luteus]|uniref:Uncharacterized protein n=1 Tax=Ereboglobus luteus TaxID=1796921 RepID=A0A2U8DYW6_9BACT|nr:hypothetical protein CKA38_00050 [Ereboglobus luteus]